MKRMYYFTCAFFMVTILFSRCKSHHESQKSASPTSSSANWKLGVALWTFHTVDFPTSLSMVDSTGVHYIEPNTFHKSGPELKDTLVGNLSPAGIEKLKEIVRRHNLIIGSVYLAGGKSIEQWKKGFELAKQLGVFYVTAEPPVDMWDSIDSLAGVYNLKVAIHEHWKGMSAYWHPDTVLAAIKDHPNFGACADLGHWPKSGINPVDGIKKLAGHIIGIHLKDIAAFNNPKLVDVRVGTGVVDFPAIFQELKKQNFNGFIYIERDSTERPSNVPSVIEEVKYYNQQVKKLK